MGAAAVPLLIASTALTAFSQIQAGQAEAAAAEFERAQYEENRKLNEIAALDEEADRRRRLSQVMASNRASATTMGVGTDGRSFLAIQDASKTEAERDIGRIRLNAKSQSYRYQLAEDQSRMAGKQAMRSGYMKAGTTLLGGGYSYSQMKTA